jgi:hypothetical protein
MSVGKTFAAMPSEAGKKCSKVKQRVWESDTKRRLAALLKQMGDIEPRSGLHIEDPRVRQPARHRKGGERCYKVLI